jgi:hypothetical protein
MRAHEPNASFEGRDLDKDEVIVVVDYFCKRPDAGGCGAHFQAVHSFEVCPNWQELLVDWALYREGKLVKKW